jgi:SAUR family protein
MDHIYNKMTDIVRLHQLLKKWKRFAIASKISISTSVPKGCFAVCVGEQMKRSVVPTECLNHVAFVDLLREAEEEFGFEQEGILRIPCDVSVFESVLQFVMKKKNGFGSIVYCSMEVDRISAQYRLQKSV